MDIEDLTIKQAKQINELLNLKEEPGIFTSDFSDLLDKEIVLFCCRYIYSGKLIKENKDSLVLANASIVFETGDFNETKFKDIQSLNCKKWSVSKQSIESFGILENKKI